jgi:hypothetical protein
MPARTPTPRLTAINSSIPTLATAKTVNMMLRTPLRTCPFSIIVMS